MFISNLDTIDEWLDKKLTSIDTRMHNHVRALQMVTQIPQRLSAIENYTNNKKSLEGEIKYIAYIYFFICCY